MSLPKVVFSPVLHYNVTVAGGQQTKTYVCPEDGTTPIDSDVNCTLSGLSQNVQYTTTAVALLQDGTTTPPSDPANFTIPWYALVDG